MANARDVRDAISILLNYERNLDIAGNEAGDVVIWHASDPGALGRGMLSLDDKDSLVERGFEWDPDLGGWKWCAR